MGKPEREKPLGAIKEENQQQTKSTYGVDGRWSPINFERTKIHFFLVTFSLPSSSSLLKVPSPATSRPHEFLSERSELFRPRSGQPSDEESNKGLF